MISRRIKIAANRATEREFGRQLFQLAGLYNWAVRKLWLDGKHGVFYSRFDLQSLIRGHGRRCGLLQETMEEVLARAHRAHHRRGNRRESARLKGKRNRMSSIPLRRGIRWVDRTHLQLPGIGRVKVRPDATFPRGAIKYGILERKARGWYVTLVVDADPAPISAVGNGVTGVDFGFARLATLSTGEVIGNPREYHQFERRLGQASRGKNYRLLARLQQRLGNTRRCRNHEVSRDLVSRFRLICVSRDNYRAIQRRFGKSVHSAAIGQLVTMLHVKSRLGGRKVIEVSNRNSTRACSACGALTGPVGWQGLKVRSWDCRACGAHHDRDVNAAVNALKAGAVLAHEMAGDRQPETRTRMREAKEVEDIRRMIRDELEGGDPAPRVWATREDALAELRSERSEQDE